MQVAATLTPSDAATVAGAMIWAYRQVTGREPVSTSSWLMPLAQSAFETASWAKLFQYNVGFISQPNRGAPFFYRGSNPVPFAVYPSLGDGCVALMHWLQKNGALAGADNNDLGAYVAGLRAGGYLGNNGDYTTYGNGIAALMQQYSNLVPRPYGAGGSVSTTMTNWQAAGIGAGVLVVAGIAAYALMRKSDPTWPRRQRSRAASAAMEAPAKLLGPLGGTSDVQSLLFARNRGWTPAKAKAWAKRNDFKYGDVDDSKPNFVRVRQAPPGDFRRMATKPFGKGSGIQAVIGYRA